MIHLLPHDVISALVFFIPSSRNVTNLLTCTRVFRRLLLSLPLQAMWLRKWLPREALMIAASAGCHLLVKELLARGVAAGDDATTSSMLNAVSFARSKVRYFHHWN